MKTHLLTTLVIGLSLLPTLAADGDATLSEQEIRAIGPLPEDKVADTVKKGDRNPFAERRVAESAKEDGESEDAKLRSMLDHMDPSGVIKDNNGRFKVLFGRTLLAEGDKFPNMLEGQVALLRVTKVTEKTVEISWVEDQVNAQARKVIRPVRVNQGAIEQRRPVPSADGKMGGILRELVTSSGETLKEPTSDQPKELAPGTAAETMKTEIESLPNAIPNHRQAPQSAGHSSSNR
jgi:hypothetical protein